MRFAANLGIQALPDEMVRRRAETSRRRAEPRHVLQSQSYDRGSFLSVTVDQMPSEGGTANLANESEKHKQGNMLPAVC